MNASSDTQSLPPKNGFFLDSSNPDTLALLRSSPAGTVVFGAGATGRAVLSAAREKKLPVAAFCDNNTTLAGSLLEGVPVMSPEEALLRHPGAYFFVAVPRFYSVIPSLKRLGLGGRCLTLDILRAAAALASLPGYIAVTVDGTAYEQKHWSPEGDGVHLSLATLVVTDHCTLRCRGCSHRIPHIANPRHRDAGRALDDMDGFLRFVDGVHTVSLSSGDSMLHPRIAWITGELLRRPKIACVSIWTNAILPFKAEEWGGFGRRLNFHVTDYGHPRQRIAAFAGAAREAGIATFVSRRDWTRIDIGGEAADADTASERFQICQLSTCITVNGHRLYRCTMVPNAAREGLIPDSLDNFVDLVRLAHDGGGEMAHRTVRHFLFDKDRMDACRYCTGGRPGETSKIPPAEQMPFSGDP